MPFCFKIFGFILGFILCGTMGSKDLKLECNSITYDIVYNNSNGALGFSGHGAPPHGEGLGVTLCTQAESTPPHQPPPKSQVSTPADLSPALGRLVDPSTRNTFWLNVCIFEKITPAFVSSYDIVSVCFYRFMVCFHL